MTTDRRSLVTLLLMLSVVAIACGAATTESPGDQAQAGAGRPWTAAETMEPAALVKVLAGGGDRPTIIYVGFQALYHPGHIPGASFHGPASEPEGLADLQRWARENAGPTTKDHTVVIYCGCCPLAQCPNVEPAYRALKAAGFTRIRVLMLPTNFATDWVGQGYPVDQK